MDRAPLGKVGLPFPAAFPEFAERICQLHPAELAAGVDVILRRYPLGIVQAAGGYMAWNGSPSVA